MKKESKTVLFEQNESLMNKKVISIMKWAIFSGPAMILLKLFGVFKTVSYSSLIFLTCILLVLYLAMYFFHKKNPYSKALKYITLISLECVVAFLAMTKGLHLAIAYVLIPVLSCMYYNEKFTFNISIVCYFIMIATYGYRAAFSEIEAGFTRLRWGLAYSSGASIEYILCSIITYQVSKNSHRTLFSVNEKNLRVEAIQDQIIKGFANLVESKDASTGEHVKRTSEYVKMLCKNLRQRNIYVEELTDEKIRYMVSASPLHDIGKIGVSDAILTKPGELTIDEFGEIKMHPTYGAQLISENLSAVEDEIFTKTAKNMAMYHHEKWDGSGYPSGLSGTDIPLCARIMAVADVLDALISERPYKKAFPIDHVFNIMREESGVHFDPVIIETLLELKPEVKKIAGIK